MRYYKKLAIKYPVPKTPPMRRRPPLPPPAAVVEPLTRPRTALRAVPITLRDSVSPIVPSFRGYALPSTGGSRTMSTWVHTCTHRSMSLPQHNGMRSFSTSVAVRTPKAWAPVQVDPDVKIVVEDVVPHVEQLRQDAIRELNTPHGRKDVARIPGNNPTRQKLKASPEQLVELMTIMRDNRSVFQRRFEGVRNVVLTGPLGTLSVPVPEFVAVVVKLREGDETRHSIFVRPTRLTLDHRERGMVGLTRAYILNAAVGVTEGFTRVLRFEGIGYRAMMEDNKLSLKLNYSHPILLDIPEGCKVQIPSPTRVVITGIDKHAVTQFAAQIRSWRPPEPYKLKGVFVGDETIKKKTARK